MFSMGNGAGGFRDRIGTGGVSSTAVRVEAAVTLGLGLGKLSFLNMI